MHCNMKTMAKTAAFLIAAAVVAYVAVPGSRELVLAFTPILLALICPVTMIGMMLMMQKKDSSAVVESPSVESKDPTHKEPSRAIHEA